MMVLGTPCHLFLSFYFFLSWVVGVTGDGEPSSYLVRVDASMVSFSAQYIFYQHILHANWRTRNLHPLRKKTRTLTIISLLGL